MAQDQIEIDDQEFWAALVPELIVSDLDRSIQFYCSICGFKIRFGRPEDKFVYLELGQAQIMLEENSEHVWLTDKLEPPFGRGLNLQIEIDNVALMYERIKASGISFYRTIKTEWYRHGEIEHGQTQFLVQDPDGYLLRFAQHLGERASKSEYNAK
jgi:catechol 2,3-dioxygenase-like lactoylglutathione lyase family enzyme